MPPAYERVNYVSDLSEKEKDKLLELILDRLSVDLYSYKFDGESERAIAIFAREKSLRCY